SLTSNQVAALLANCSITNKSGEACNRDTNLGYGIIDAYLAVTEALALADDDANIPAIVGTSRTQLNLGTGSVQDFVLSNIGGSKVTGLTVTVSSGSSWLSVVEQSVNSEKLGTYRATVNRTGLVNGRYNGIISVSYRDSATPDETKSLQINLTMQVGALASPGTIAPQYVLLEDAVCIEENCVVDTVLADSGTGYFVFNDVSPGNYRLYAGSDIDVDGLICGAGETCGAYPTTGSVQIIEVSDSNVTGTNCRPNLNGAGGGASRGTLQRQTLQPAGQPGKAR